MSAAARTSSHARGFTLVELLAALVVFGFVVAGLAQGVRMGLLATRVQTETAGRDADLDTASRALTRLLVAVAPAGPAGPPTLAGNAHSLAFTTTLPVRIGAVPTDQADARLRLANGVLQLALTPHYHATLFGRPPPPSVLALADGVASLTIAYWAAASGTWRTAWTEPLPPALVRVTIGFADARRDWPPIVVAPRLARFAQ